MFHNDHLLKSTNTDMLNVYFAVAANRVIVDSVSNQVSIIDLYENLRASTFPVLVPKLTLLFYVSRESNDPATQDLTLVCELGGKTIFDVAVHMDFKNEDTTRIIMGVDGLTLPEPGLLKAKLMDKGVELGTLDLTVVQIASVGFTDNPSQRH
jgi:hypothetical protein